MMLRVRTGVLVWAGAGQQHAVGTGAAQHGPCYEKHRCVKAGERAGGVAVQGGRLQGDAAAPQRPPRAGMGQRNAGQPTPGGAW